MKLLFLITILVALYLISLLFKGVKFLFKNIKPTDIGIIDLKD